MHVVLLGTAAGGGFPQWNCWCPGCRLARSTPSAAHPRTQSCAAVSVDGQRWFLLNASPDIRQQLDWIAPAEPPDAARYVGIEGIVFTDAELDHTLGLVLLREAGLLHLHATAPVAAILEHDSRLLATTSAFSRVRVRLLDLDQALDLHTADGAPSGLSVEPFPVAAGPPRFASADEPGHTVGLLVREAATGRTCAFVPGCGGLDEELLARLDGVDALLFDGTFWSDTELIELGIGSRTAREIDHVPISGPGGSLERLAALRCRHRVYTHINNTNPILVERSPERDAVTRSGLTVGLDGMRILV